MKKEKMVIHRTKNGGGKGEANVENAGGTTKKGCWKTEKTEGSRNRGTYKWELAEIPAVKSTPVETAKPKTETKKVSKKKTSDILSD